MKVVSGGNSIAAIDNNTRMEQASKQQGIKKWKLEKMDQIGKDQLNKQQLTQNVDNIDQQDTTTATIQHL